MQSCNKIPMIEICIADSLLSSSSLGPLISLLDFDLNSIQIISVLLFNSTGDPWHTRKVKKPCKKKKLYFVLKEISIRCPDLFLAILGTIEIIYLLVQILYFPWDCRKLVWRNLNEINSMMIFHVVCAPFGWLHAVFPSGLWATTRIAPVGEAQVDPVFFGEWWFTGNPWRIKVLSGLNAVLMETKDNEANWTNMNIHVCFCLIESQQKRVAMKFPWMIWGHHA